MSLQETRAAVLAIRGVSNLPIMATLTFEKDGRTLYGTPPEAAVVVLQELGVSAIGLNCSTGPADMVSLIDRMYAYATVPLIAKPNAGLPEIEDGKTVYKMTPAEFAKDAAILVEHGAHIVGGCCGTTPEHIKALTDAVTVMTPLPTKKKRNEFWHRNELSSIYLLTAPCKSLVNVSIRQGKRRCKKNFGPAKWIRSLPLRGNRMKMVRSFSMSIWGPTASTKRYDASCN